MIMDRHYYGQHLSEEPDMFEIGLHPGVDDEEEEEEEDSSLHCRQVRVLNLIDLLFGDNHNDYNNDHGHDHGYDQLSHGEGRSTPLWQQGQEGCDTSFGNGHSSPSLTLSSPSSSSSLSSSSSTSTSSADDNQLDLLQRRNTSSATNNSTITTNNSTNDSLSDTHVAMKRRPGRPPKGSFSSSRKRAPSPHPPEVSVAPKRGRGRPKKHPSAHPPSSSSRPLLPSVDVAVKRGPGRPRKHPLPPPPILAPLPPPPGTVVPVPAKRGPGRPPKVPSSSSSSKKLPPSPHPPDTKAAAVAVKQHPGRPKSSLISKTRPALISTSTITTRARARAKTSAKTTIRRVRLIVREPSQTLVSSSNTNAIDAADSASILTMRPVPVVMVPKRRGPGRPRGSRNRRHGLY